MKIGWEWWLLGSSVLAGLIFLVVILAIKKSQNKTNTEAWKKPFVFLWTNLLRPKKLIMWTILGAICWGGYLFVCYLWPTPERLAFKELSKNLAEIELKPEKDKLAVFNEKVKNGERLTEAEKREAMEADKKIEKVRKDYSDGKLVPPPPKPASVKPKEEVWDWTFEWEATSEQLASGRQKIPELINDTQFVFCDDKVLKFKYKRPSGKIVNMTLDRNKPETEHYFGRVAQSDLYLRVWLIPNPEEPGNFKGTADNGPNTISVDIFLKKKL